MDEPAPADLEPLHFQCNVWEPGHVLDNRGMKTCNLWIQAGRISIRPKSRWFARWYDFDQIDYTWPTVVLQKTVASFRCVSLLIDIDGQLGAAVMARRLSLAAHLDAYGFNVIKSPGPSWSTRLWTPRPGKPLPVPREVLGSHVGEVPPSLLAMAAP